MEKDKPVLQINLLGNPKVSLGNDAPLKVPKKLLALLAYITMQQQTVQRSKLILLFWSDVSDESARRSLRTALSELKKLLGEFLEVTRQEVSLDWGKPISVDALELQESLSIKPIDFKRLQAAIALYRGDFLADVELKDSLEFDDWRLTQQEHSQQLAFQAFNKLIESNVKNKDFASALNYGQQMLDLNKWREESHYQLIYIHGIQGNRNAALQQYEKCKQLLAEALDAEPSEEIEDLIKQIRSGQLQQDKSPQGELTSSTKISNLPKDLTPPAFLTEEKETVKQTLFVGRKKELGQLQEALGNACKGQGRVRLVLGSAGQGKSHLLQKFANDALEANPELLVLTGYCNQQAGVGDPYLPFRHILLLLLGDVEARWRGGLISTAHAKRLWQAMKQTIPQVAKHAPDLISSFLTGVPLIERLILAGLEQEPWFEEVSQLASEKLLGTLEQVRIISLYTSALQAIAKVRPILLILEDLHWVDASSAALFNHLSKYIAENPILLIGSYRPTDVLANEAHPIQETSRELQRLYGNVSINLEEQKEEAEREFVNAYLDNKPNKLGDDFRETLFKHTRGHALFTTELLNTLKDRGDLYQQDGKWFARDNIDWQKLPAKIEGVIEVRVGRLPNEQRELLSIASVQGEAFIGEAVAQVQRQSERDVIRALSNEIEKRHQLVQSERMERLGQQRLSHYRFRHNLFQQYVYSNLAETERTYLHEDIALALETMYGEEVKKIAPQLAWHFEQAGNLEKTFEYLLISGQQAQILGSNKEAISHYERGLALMSQLTITSEFLSTELAFQAGLGMALLPVEGLQSEGVRISFERALELCRQIGGTDSQLMITYAGLAYYAANVSTLSLKTCLEWVKEFRAIAEKQEDLAHLAAADSMLMMGYFFVGHYDKAIEIGRSFLSYNNFDQTSHENMIRHYTHDQRVTLMPTLAWVLFFKGKLKEAKTLITKEPLPNFSHAASRAFFLATYSTIYQCLNDFTRLKLITEELLKIADEYGYAFWKAWGLISHGWTIAKLGQLEQGIAEMQQGIAITRMAGGLIRGPCSLAMLAEGLGLMGRYDEALSILEEALIYSKTKDEIFYMSQLNCLKGKCLQKLGAEKAEIEKYFKQAVTIAKEQDIPMIELQAALSLAKYWLANSKKEEVNSLLTELLERITPIIDFDIIPEYVEAREILTEMV